MITRVRFVGDLSVLTQTNRNDARHLVAPASVELKLHAKDIHFWLRVLIFSLSVFIGTINSTGAATSGTGVKSASTANITAPLHEFYSTDKNFAFNLKRAYRSLFQEANMYS